MEIGLQNSLCQDLRSSVNEDTTLQYHRDLIPEATEILNLEAKLLGSVQHIKDCKSRPQGSHTVRFAPAGIPSSISHYWHNPDFNQQPDRGLSDNRKFWDRLAMAVIGGISLVVPMLIMALHRSRVVSLVTTSLAVTLFAVLLASWPLLSKHFPWEKTIDEPTASEETLGSKDVLLATAAYAAVLVVFVGASLSTVT